MRDKSLMITFIVFYQGNFLWKINHFKEKILKRRVVLTKQDHLEGSSQ